MTNKAIENWFRSRRFVRVNGESLRPMEHRRLKGIPLSACRGQAEVFWLEEKNGQIWLLKKFHLSRCPDFYYLEQIGTLLPKDKAFSAGITRKVLRSSMITRGNGDYYRAELSEWLNNTILMIKVQGLDWSSVSDKLRDGSLVLTPAQRLALCRKLCELVSLMEHNQISHRDLSSGNVFIDIQTLEMYFIDFDSVYHPSLSMPEGTTCGTEGYIAPFVRHGNIPEAKASWYPMADRYALAILIVELLLLNKNSPLTGDGGMFNQEELYQRSGRDLDQILTDLRQQYPAAVTLFKTTINSNSFAGCPAPADWISVCDASANIFTAPRLNEMEKASFDGFKQKMKHQKVKDPIWPAPSLEDIPTFDVKPPQKSRQSSFFRNKKTPFNHNYISNLSPQPMKLITIDDIPIAGLSNSILNHKQKISNHRTNLINSPTLYPLSSKDKLPFFDSKFVKIMLKDCTKKSFPSILKDIENPWNKRA